MIDFSKLKPMVMLHATDVIFEVQTDNLFTFIGNACGVLDCIDLIVILIWKDFI